MNPFNFTQLLTQAVDELSDYEGLKELFHQHRHGDPIPSGPVLEEIVGLCRAILFPGYYGRSTVDSRTVKYRIGVDVERLYMRLTEQVEAACALRVRRRTTIVPCAENREKAAGIAAALISRLPALRRTLATDVEAAYLGDPAAENYGEVISCYPVIKALSNYRIAHELLQLGGAFNPPHHYRNGAQRDRYRHPSRRADRPSFHYRPRHGRRHRRHLHYRQSRQALPGRYARRQEFSPRRRRPPHQAHPRATPILEDDVIVYSNATILGRITIGRGATIGGNLWVTEDVAPGERLIQRKNAKQ